MNKRRQLLFLVGFIAVLIFGLGIYLANSKFHFLADVGVKNYYVATDGDDSNPGTIDAPFLTLDKARDTIRILKNIGPLTQPVNVNLRQGSYLLSTPFTLDERDSGSASNPITYQSYPDEKATLTTGVIVQPSWTKVSGKEYYVTDLASTIEPFNSLFVDGLRATRARTPNENEPFFNTRHDDAIIGLNGKTEFAYDTGNIDPSWSNKTDMQVVSLQRWLSVRYNIETIDSQKVTIKGENPTFWDTTMPGWEWQVGFYSSYNGVNRYFIDNVFEKLDAQNEWYFNKNEHKLYYLPKEGTEINKSVFVVPTGEQLVNIGPSTATDYDIADGFTLSSWIKTSGSYGMTNIMSNTDDANGFRLGFSYGYITYLIGNKGEAGVSLKEGVTNSRVLDVNAPPAWHMISATYDLKNKKVRLYFDGAFKWEDNLVGDYTWFKKDLPTLGKKMDPLATDNNTMIDESKMYSRVLNDSEIVGLYQHQEIKNGNIFSLSFDESTFNSPVGQDDYNQREYVGKVENPNQSVVLDPNMTLSEGVQGKGYQLSNDKWIDLNGYTVSPSDINFKNLNFAYTDWGIDANGYYSGQAGINGMSPPAIKTTNTVNIGIINNSLSNVGGFAVADIYSKNLKIDNNNFYDLGSGGVLIKQDKFSQSTNILTGSHQITNNKINNIGTVFADGGVGVLIILSGNNLIAHNTIFNTTYSGMSLGLNWTFNQTLMKENLIENNVIHDVMQLLDDGAGIYTNSRQDGTVYQNNIIYNVIDTPQHKLHWRLGFYAEHGTTGITVKNNLIYNTGSGLWLRVFRNSTAQNNIVYDPNTTDSLDGYISPVCVPPGGDGGAEDFGIGAVINHNVVYMKKDLQNIYLNFPPYCGPNKGSDYNLYDNQTGNPGNITQLSELQNMTPKLDEHSKAATIQFEYVANKNFCLKSESLALIPGFKNFFNCKITDEPAYTLAGPDIGKYLYDSGFIVTVDKNSTTSGDTLTYIVTYTNTTTQTFSNMVISDPIPNATQYVADSASENGQLVNNTLTWQIPTLPPGQTFSATFQVLVL